MSERGLKRIQVLTEVLADRRMLVSAAAVLALGGGNLERGNVEETH